MENKLMYDPKITLYRLKLVVEMFGAQLLDEPTNYNLINEQSNVHNTSDI